MSSEDDTYNMLKGLTDDEVDAILTKAWIDISAETDPLGQYGVSIQMLRDKVDPLLVPFGRSYDEFFKLTSREIK
jgi:hypothetical protein